MSKVLHFFINTSTLWLLMNLLTASLLCFIPIVWAQTLTEQTLSQGLLLALLFLVPSELYRQFKVEIDAYLAKHGLSTAGNLSRFVRNTFPTFHRLDPDLALAYRNNGPRGSANSKSPKTVTLKLQCWKCGAEIPHLYTPDPSDKSGSMVKVTKTCPMCHATCLLSVPADQLYSRRLKTQASE